MHFSIYTLLPLLLVLVFGCEKNGGEYRESESSAKSEKKTQTFETMPTNGVVVVVNGVSLDKKSVLREIAIQMEIYQCSHPNARISDVKKFRRKMLANAEKLFIQRQALLSEVARRKMVLTEGERKAMRRTFADNVLKGKVPYDKFLSSLEPDMRQELESGLDKDMLCQKLNATIYSECPGTIPDDELNVKFKNLTEYNIRAKADEDNIWQNASNAWHRIVAGESFEKIGNSLAKTNEHVKCDMEWGAFELDFFKEDKQLCQYLTSMPVGSVTPPVTGDNGLLIVKLLETQPVDFNSGSLKPRYGLAMIFFELPEYYPLSTKEQLRKELSAMKIEDELKKRMKAIVDSARIEYPQGKCVMPKK